LAGKPTNLIHFPATSPRIADFEAPPGLTSFRRGLRAADAFAKEEFSKYGTFESTLVEAGERSLERVTDPH